MGHCFGKTECKQCEAYELFINDSNDNFSELPLIKIHRHKKYMNLKKQKMMNINQIYKIENGKLNKKYNREIHIESVILDF